ncbi:hypothetical protein BKA70DRAFT_1560648 [Coprinopsis sp. MPI-PUGE-AT-0042]|nr:hypothetical protein BKA70DRAFT_1560648 [Coprinopsis sp. MPI-PUGE-AT-0042]
MPSHCHLNRFEMASSQKQPALHITQKDLIEQLRGEVEHLRREVNELQEDKRALRSDQDHLKKTNMRLEVERAELLMALLNRRPTHGLVDAPRDQSQNEETQAGSSAGWPQPLPSPVGRLVPITSKSQEGSSYGCVDGLPDEEATRPSTSQRRTPSSEPQRTTFEKAFQGFHPLNPDAHGYFQGQIPTLSGSRSVRSVHSPPQYSQRKPTPTQPRGFMTNETYTRDQSQNSSPSRKGSTIPPPIPKSGKANRKRKNIEADSAKQSKRGRHAKAEQPTAEAQAQGWNGKGVEYGESRGRNVHRDSNIASKSNQRVTGGNYSQKSIKDEQKDGYVKRSHSQQHHGQNYGQGAASRSQSVASWNRGAFKPSHHMRFT